MSKNKIITTQYMGPIPSPEMMEAFQRVSPDLLPRIMALTEEADKRKTLMVNAHLREIDNQRLAIAGSNIMGILGVTFSFLIAIAFIGAMIFFVVNGETSAAILSGTPAAVWFIFAAVVRNLKRKT